MNPRPTEAQIEDQKRRKSLRRSSIRRKKTTKPIKYMKSGKSSKMAKKSQERLKLKNSPKSNSP
jgi:hypothetical protein